MTRKSGIHGNQLLIAVAIILVISIISFSEQSDGAKIGGFVKDLSGDPIKGAEVIIKHQNLSIIHSQVTNETGEYKFYGIPMGNYSLHLNFSGKELFRQNITLTSNRTVKYDIHLSIFINDTDDDSNGAKANSEKDESDSGKSLILIFIVLFVVIIIISLAIFSRIRRSQLLKHDTRQRICSHILDNPGKHFTALKNELALPTGVMSYHLDRLERENFILSRKEGKFKRFYPPRWDQVPELRLTPIQETILEQIKKQPGISQSDITRNIGRNRKVVNYQVHQLEDMDLITIEKDGRESMCYFVRNA